MVENPLYPPPSIRIPPPRFSGNATSPLRSPKRRTQILSDHLDPLLGNLSPELILDALSAINAVPKHEKQAKDLLVKSISQVSDDERALGARAAIAAQKLREWLKEIQGWKWPTGKDVRLGKGFIPPSTSESEPIDSGTEYLGSLPAHLVAKYETRIEEIRDGMDSLDVEELKEHVLNVHIPGRSRPSSSNSAISVMPPPLSYVQLSDFTAVITATILRALPTLSRLNILLNIWDVRLVVSRQIPGLLMALRFARDALDSSRMSLKEQTQHSDLFSLDMFRSKKDELEEIVLAAGRKMDKILDALEGRDDSLPETWIDDLEAIEEDFGRWVVEAERRAVENEWKRFQSQQRERKKAEASVPPVNETSNKPTEKISSEHEGKVQLIEPVAEYEANVSDEKALGSDSEGDDTPPILNNDAVVVSEAPAPTSTQEADTAHAEAAAELGASQPTSNNIFPPSAIPATSQSQPQLISSHISPENDDTPTQTVPSSPKEDNLVSVPDSTEDTEGRSSIEAACRDTLDGSADSASESNSLDPAAEVAASSHIIHSGSDSSPPKTKDGHTQVLIKEKMPRPCGAEELSEAAGNNNAMPSRSEEVSEKLNNGADIREQPSDDSLLGSHEQEGLDSPKDVALSTPNSTIVLSSRLPENSNEVENNPVPGEEATEFGVDSRLPEPPTDSPLSNALPTDISESGRPRSKELVTLDAVDIVKNSDDSVLEEAKMSVGHVPTTPERVLQSRPAAPDLEAEEAQSVLEERSIVSTELQSSPGSTNNASPEKSIEHQFHRATWVNVPTPGLTISSSPPLTSPDSDRTLREGLSPPIDPRLLSDRRSFRHTKMASLPLQRFINDGIHANYEVNDGFQTDVHSTPRRASDASIGRLAKNEQQIRTVRKKTDSPPSNVVPRPALRPTRSSLAKGTSSTQHESSSSILKGHPRTFKPNSPLSGVSDRRRPPQRFASLEDVHLGVSSRNTGRSIVGAAGDLRSQPSFESIGSFNSNSEAGDLRSNLSFSMDDESFAMIRPFNDTDDQLQEKINSILTSIPGRIRLSSTPAWDFDQRSTTSSISGSKRERFSSRSPFSTPSRSSTPTPSLTLAPASSRPRRSHAHASEEKTVRVYHLHQRGKAEPTKLFVRSVGQDGERVMVRVGGGWADLGEYLREYVHHHGRRAVSSTHLEVQDLPTKASSAISSSGSTLTPTTDNDRSTPLSRPASVMSNRPSSSLSVRKTRRPSSLAPDLPDLTEANIQRVTEHTPSPASGPFSRRLSISSINSISVSSVVGDGSSVYSPYPGSSRTPLQNSHTTPLGLAGPKPRARHVSMSPESEAWVEDVIGQARRTSSSMKLQKHTEIKEPHPGVRTNNRSVSDIGVVGNNKRVSLRGLGSKAEKE